MSAPRATSTGGGVNKLRAMFENKQPEELSSSSPPDRGRSPAHSIGGGSAATSPRPLSKVRTNFVAVENRGGQIGLVRMGSDDGQNGASNGTRRPGFSQDQKDHPEEVAERKQSIQLEFQARKMSTAIEETIPESAIESAAPTPAGETPRPGLSERTSYMNGKKAAVAAASTPSGNPDKPVSVAEDKEAELLPADPTSAAAVSGGEALDKTGSAAEVQNGKAKTSSSVKTNGKANTSKPTPISTAKTSNTTSTPNASSKPVKTPTTPKNATSPTKATHSAKPATEPKASKPASKPARTSTSSIGPPPKKDTPPAAKARSPTRPVKLPSSLTAPTASSRQKTDAAPGPRQSLAPTNGTQAGANKNTSRSPSTTVRSGVNAIKNERPTLGRPSIGGKDKPKEPKKEVKEADEGFLARMMRPTAASKSKVQEKVEHQSITPPRKAASSVVDKKEVRPATRDGSVKGDAKSFGSPVVKKALKVPHEEKTEVPKKEEKVLTLKENAPPPTPKKAEPKVDAKEVFASSKEPAKPSRPSLAPAAEIKEARAPSPVAKESSKESTVQEPLVLSEAPPTDTKQPEKEESALAKETAKAEEPKPAEEPSLVEAVSSAASEAATTVSEKLSGLRLNPGTIVGVESTD